MNRIHHLRGGAQHNQTLPASSQVAAQRSRALADLDPVSRAALDVLASEGGSTRDVDSPAELTRIPAPGAPCAADAALMRALSITRDGSSFVFQAQRFSALRDAVDLARRSPLDRWGRLTPAKMIR